MATVAFVNHGLIWDQRTGWRLRSETSGDVYVASLADHAVITVRERAASEMDAERLERELRLRAHRRLRAAGAFG